MKTIKDTGWIKAHADSSLLEAAPEMLEALKMAVVILSPSPIENYDALTALMYVIAKAEGRQ